MRASLLAAVLVLSLVGCSTAPRPVPPGAPEAAEPSAGTATTPLPPQGTTEPGSDAVAALLADAARACEAGDIGTGLARLDRGLRIAPQSADLYLAMARCHRAEGDDERAAAAAERGMAYCGGSQCRALRRFIPN